MEPKGGYKIYVLPSIGINVVVNLVSKVPKQPFFAESKV